MSNTDQIVLARRDEPMGPPCPVRILVVEDEAVVAMDIEWQLVRMGYLVCGRADTALQALTLANERHPDLVLMDIVIKGPSDGVEAAGYIARRLDIPIVFLTAYSDPHTIARAIGTAPSGYLTKPFQPRELFATIELAMHKSALERQLRESEQWFASTLRCVGDAAVATDANGSIRFLNPAAESLTGWTLPEARGKNADDIVHLIDPDTRAPVALPTAAALAKGNAPSIRFGTLLKDRQGRECAIDDSAAAILDGQGVVLGAVIVLRDVRDRIATLKRLQESEERFRQAFESAPVGMAMVSVDGRILQANRTLSAMLGRSPEALIGSEHDSLSIPEEKEQLHHALQQLLSGRSATEQLEKRYRLPDGRTIWTITSISLLVREGKQTCYLVQLSDISERKAAETQLIKLAHFDPLTGLANRLWLGEEIERAIASARRHEQKLAVVFIDLDHFKQVNDNLGHEAGDHLLKAIAQRLRQTLRETDLAARLGGDEFVILLQEIHEIDDVLLVAEKIRMECERPVELNCQTVRIGASLGVSLYPDDAQDAPSLLRYADSALYHAKAEGRNHLQFYRPELSKRMEERLELGSSLRGALERHEFVLHFQPIMAMESGRVVAAEALIRWNHPERGEIGPDVFMPLVEDLGLSEQIGDWVIAEACRQAAQWERIGMGNTGISVNVSAAQFRSGRLVSVISRALMDTGLEPSQLRIEITEQTLLDDTEKNRTTVEALRKLGVRIAIDDFGTGYSSLSYIGQFRPSGLKIDRSLISGGAIEGDRATIVIAAIAMARGLHLDVVTEGVETLEQQAFLLSHGCEMAQGYFYAMPAPAPEFLHWLEMKAAGPGSQGLPH